MSAVAAILTFLILLAGASRSPAVSCALAADASVPLVTTRSLVSFMGGTSAQEFGNPGTAALIYNPEGDSFSAPVVTAAGAVSTVVAPSGDVLVTIPAANVGWNDPLAVTFIRGSDMGGGVGGLLYSLRPAGTVSAPAPSAPAVQNVTPVDYQGADAWEPFGPPEGPFTLASTADAEGLNDLFHCLPHHGDNLHIGGLIWAYKNGLQSGTGLAGFYDSIKAELNAIVAEGGPCAADAAALFPDLFGEPVPAVGMACMLAYSPLDPTVSLAYDTDPANWLQTQYNVSVVQPEITTTVTLAPSYNFYNARGDVVLRTDADAKATWEGHYEAFGRRIGAYYMAAESGTAKDRQRANTKEEDPTGLLNEGFRYRDLSTGVFISRDPAGFVDGPNVYTYVRQNPWTAFDPDGLKEHWHHMVPQQFADKLQELYQFNVHDSRYGAFLNDADHLALHKGQKYNKHWDKFIKKLDGASPEEARRRITRHVDDLLEGKSMKRSFRKILKRATAIGEGLDYLRDWHWEKGLLNSATKESKILRGGVIQAAHDAANAGKLAKFEVRAAEAAAEGAGKFGKRLPIVRWALFGVIASAGQTYAREQGFSEGGAAAFGAIEALNPLPVGLEDTIEASKFTAGAVNDYAQDAAYKSLPNPETGETGFEMDARHMLDGYDERDQIDANR